MMVDLNRKEDTVTITGISIADLVMIMASLEICSHEDQRAADLSAKFKKIEEEIRERDGIT